MIGKQFNKDSVALVYITVLAVIALVYGFITVPSPAKEREMTLDHKRVVDLGLLQSSIDTYFQTNSILPKTLDDLTPNTTSGLTKVNKTDPQTQQQYEYQITSPLTYNLCATFTTDSTKEDQNLYDQNNPQYSTYQDQFKHPAEHYCFSEKETDYTTYDTPTPYVSPAVADSPLNPTAALTAFDKNGKCQWTPAFSLRGFAPSSAITVHSQGTLSDNCDASKTHSYSWTASWNRQTDEKGSVVIDYLQGDYGDYTYTFTDSQGNRASVHFSYDQNSTVPVILPSQNTGQSANAGGAL